MAIIGIMALKNTKIIKIGECGQYLVNMYKKGQNSQNLAKLMEIDQKGWKYVKKMVEIYQISHLNY